jgi:hypothetical protein
LLLRQDAFAWHKPQLLPNGKSDPYLIPGLKTDNGIVHPNKVGEPLTHRDALEAMSPEAQKAFIEAGHHNDETEVVSQARAILCSVTTPLRKPSAGNLEMR